jgi:hypothetical protein
LTSLALILVLLALGWLWLDSLRARELATGVAAEMCRRRGLQFLDETVALARLGLRRTPAGLRIRRLYRFDYSEGGMGRHTGHVLMVGAAVAEFSLGLPGDGVAEPPEEPEPDGAARPEGEDERKVLPFRRRDPQNDRTR